MALPGWTKEYNDIGLAAIPPAIVSQLRLAQHRYGTFADFFSAMTKFYEGRSGISKRLVTAMENARSASTYIGILLGSKGRTATPEEIEAMYSTMDKVDSEVKSIRQYAGESTRFSKILTETEKNVGVTIDQVQKTNATMNTRLKNLGKLGFGKMGAMLQQTSPGLVQSGQGIRSALFNSVLGPFAGMAKVGIDSATGIYKHMRQKKLEKDQMKAAVALDPMMKLKPEELLRSVERERGRGPSLGGNIDPEHIRGGRQPKSPRFEAEPSGTIRDAFSSKPTDLNKMAMPLFTFFDKKAYDAKWTKEVVELLRKISKSTIETSKIKGGSDFGILDMLGAKTLFKDFGKTLKPIIPILGFFGRSIGIVAAAIAGWQIGKQIGKIKVGDKSVNEHTQGMFEKGFGLWNSVQDRGKNDKLDPIAKRAKELVKTYPTLNPKHAVELARKEAGLSTSGLDIESNRGIVHPGTMFPMTEVKDRLDKAAITIQPQLEDMTSKMERIGVQANQAVMDSGVMESMQKIFGKMEKTFADLKPSIKTSPHFRRGAKGSIWNLGDTLTEGINSGEANQRE